MRPSATGLLAVFTVAVACRVAVAVWVTHDYPERADHPTDALGYHLLANNIADGRGYIRPFDHLHEGKEIPTAEFPPGFPALLAVVSLGGGTAIVAHKAATIAIGAATAVVAALLGLAITRRRIGVVAGIVAAAHPGLLQQDSVLLAEALYAALVALALLVAWWLWREPSRRRLWIMLGLVLGAASLTRGEGAFLAVGLLAAVVVALPRQHWRGGMAGGAVAASVLVAIVGGWVIRNAVVVGEPTISSNYSTLLAGANCDGAYYGRFVGTWRASCLFGIPVPAGTSEADRADLYQSTAARYVRDHTSRLAIVVPARVLRTWGLLRPGDLDDTTRSEGRDPRWDAVARVIDAALTLVALAAIAVRRRREMLIPLVPVLVVIAASAIGYGNERFRFPAVIPLLALAAIGTTRAPA